MVLIGNEEGKFQELGLKEKSSCKELWKCKILIVNVLGQRQNMSLDKPFSPSLPQPSLLRKINHQSRLLQADLKVVWFVEGCPLGGTWSLICERIVFIFLCSPIFPIIPVWIIFVFSYYFLVCIHGWCMKNLVSFTRSSRFWDWLNNNLDARSNV